MKLATGAQMHALDQKTIQETGIAGIVLMENASRAVAERAATYGLDQRCVVVAGGGNNGGDGFAIARRDGGFYWNRRETAAGCAM